MISTQADIDYIGFVEPRILVFHPGSNTPCNNFTILDDNILEDNETFTVQLETADIGVVIPLSPGLNNATVTIVDDDGIGFYISSSRLVLIPECCYYCPY